MTDTDMLLVVVWLAATVGVCLVAARWMRLF